MLEVARNVDVLLVPQPSAALRGIPAAHGVHCQVEGRHRSFADTSEARGASLRLVRRTADSHSDARPMPNR